MLLPRKIAPCGSLSILGGHNGEWVYPNKHSVSCLDLHHRPAVEALDGTLKIVDLMIQIVLEAA